MRPSRLFTLAAFAAVLSACASGTTPHSTPQTSPASTPACQSTTDTVARVGTAGVVDVQPPNASQQAVTTITPLRCSTRVRVASNASAELRYASGATATCQFWQDDPAHKVASLISRDQPNDFFTLGEGEVVCTWPPSSPHGTVRLCDGGTLLINGTFGGSTTCNPDPLLRVAVLRGSVGIIVPGLNTVIEARRELDYNLSTQQFQVVAANFSATEVAVLDAQALEAGLAITLAPQTITFTSVPPASPVIGAQYTVTAQGGGSGYPVTFAIDPSSGKICVLSGGQTVTFLSAGTCIIDATQAGNLQFEAAPQAQQSITVPPPTIA